MYHENNLYVENNLVHINQVFESSGIEITVILCIFNNKFEFQLKLTAIHYIKIDQITVIIVRHYHIQILWMFIQLYIYSIQQKKCIFSAKKKSVFINRKHIPSRRNMGTFLNLTKLEFLFIWVFLEFFIYLQRLRSEVNFPEVSKTWNLTATLY